MILKENFEVNLQKINSFKQKNFYFDTPKYNFKKNGMTIRIRVLNGCAPEFTIKKKFKNKFDKNYSEKYEKKFTLSMLEFEKILKGRFLNIERLYTEIERVYDGTESMDKLIFIGCLETERTEYKLEGFEGKLCLDKNNILEEEDYELEWETDEYEIAKNKILELFLNMRISPINNYDSKSTRLFKKFGMNNEVVEKERKQ